MEACPAMWRTASRPRSAMIQHFEVAGVAFDKANAMREVGETAGGEIVQHDDFIGAFQKQFGDMTADETRAAGDENPFSHDPYQSSRVREPTGIRPFQSP